jgi:hypothetical protein
MAQVFVGEVSRSTVTRVRSLSHSLLGAHKQRYARGLLDEVWVPLEWQPNPSIEITWAYPPPATLLVTAPLHADFAKAFGLAERASAAAVDLPMLWAASPPLRLGTHVLFRVEKVRWSAAALRVSHSCNMLCCTATDSGQYTHSAATCYVAQQPTADSTLTALQHVMLHGNRQRTVYS